MNIFLGNGDMSELLKVEFGLLFYLYVTVGITILYHKCRYSYDFTEVWI